MITELLIATTATVGFSFSGGDITELASQYSEQVGEPICVQIPQRAIPSIDDPWPPVVYSGFEIEADSAEKVNALIAARIEADVVQGEVTTVRRLALPEYMITAGTPWENWTGTYAGNLRQSYGVDSESGLVEAHNKPLPFSLSQLPELDFDKPVVVADEFIDRHGIFLVADKLTQPDFLATVCAAAGAKIEETEHQYRIVMDIDLHIKQRVYRVIKLRASATSDFERARLDFVMAAIPALGPDAFVRMARGVRPAFTRIPVSSTAALEGGFEIFARAIKTQYPQFASLINYNGNSLAALGSNGPIWLEVPHAQEGYIRF